MKQIVTGGDRQADLNALYADFAGWTPIEQHAAFQGWSKAADRYQKMIDERNAVIEKARDLIGDQAGDITGAALDAWVLLENAVPKRGSSGE